MLRHPITRNGGSIVHNVVLQDLSSFPTLRIPFFEETNTSAGHGNENVLYLKTLVRAQLTLKMGRDSAHLFEGRLALARA